MTRRPRPPRLARLLVSLLIGAHAREVVVGDLDEEFWRAIEAGVTPPRARRRYWRQALASIAACRFGASDSPRAGPGGGPHPGAGGGPHPGQGGGPHPGPPYVRGAWIATLTGGIRRDVRFALRLFRRQKASTGAVLAGLAVAIGLGTALFGVMNALLFRTLTVERPESLRWVRQMPMPPSRTGAGAGVSLIPSWTRRDVEHLREHAASVRIAGVLRTAARIDTGSGVAEHTVPVWFVSPEFFAMTGARSAAGRLLAPADNHQTTSAPVVVSHAFWRRRLDGDPAIVGRTVLLSGRPFTVVGVTARGFTGPSLDSPAFWAPLAVYDLDWRDGGALPPGGSAGGTLLARLTPGSSPARAEAELAALVRSLGGEAGTPAFELLPLETEWIVREGAAVTATVGVLIALVLLLGSGNVANLLVAGAAARQAEIGTRLALGASRSRVVGQMLTESLLLGLIGGSGGWLLAAWLTPVLANLVDVPSTYEIAPGARVHAFLAVAAVLAGIVAGLAPARFGVRGDLPSALDADADRAPAAPGRFSTIVVGVQASIAMATLVLGVSLARAASRAANVEVGFDVERLLEVRWSIPATADAVQGRGLYERTAERLRSLPMVERVAASRFSPISGSHRRLGVPERGSYRIYEKETSAEYFATLGMAIRQGRVFSEEEIAAGVPVAVIAARLARDFWPGASPIGDRLDRVHSSLAGVTVVGVVGDVTSYSVLDTGRDATAVYRPLPPHDSGLRVLIVRTHGDAAAAAASVRAALHDLRPTHRAAIRATRQAIDDQMRAAATPARVAAISVAAIVALAVIGAYGLVTFAVGQRRREIAVRMALGASKSAILARVLADVLRPVAAGLVAGVGLAWVAGRWLSAILLGVPAHDPLSIATAVVLLVAVASLSILAPCRRATGLDPAAVLRQQ